MGVRLSFYTASAYREILLPPLDNSDHRVFLHKKNMGLSDSLVLRFEILDGVWRFLPGKDMQASERIHQDMVLLENAWVLRDRGFLQIFTASREYLTMLVNMEERTVRPFQRFDLHGFPEISVGRNPENMIVYNNHGLVSGRQARLVQKNGKWEIRSEGTNGSYRNGKLIRTRADLKYGDYLQILGLRMLFLEDMLLIDLEGIGKEQKIQIKRELLSAQLTTGSPKAAARRQEKPDDNAGLFHRSPRSMGALPEKAVKIVPPPQSHARSEQPFFLQAGQLFTMAVPMLAAGLFMVSSSKKAGNVVQPTMYTGIVMALLTLCTGLFWAAAGRKYSDFSHRKQEKERMHIYEKYLEREEMRIRNLYEETDRILQEMYPPAEICMGYGRESSRLWNRNVRQRDYLCQRLGTGERLFQVKIDVPQESFMEGEDLLKKKPSFLKKNYEKLQHVPVLLDLGEHPVVGLVGGEGKKGAFSVMRILTAQIAASNCYTEVKLVYIFREEEVESREMVEFARWLPHVWSDDRLFRFYAVGEQEAGEVFFRLGEIFRSREEKEAGEDTAFYIIFLSDISLAENRPEAKYLLDGSRYGLCTLILAENSGQLPNVCRYMVVNDGLFAGTDPMSFCEEERTSVDFDEAGSERLEMFARRLCGIRVPEHRTNGEIPDSADFLEMFGVLSPQELHSEERWRKNKTYEHLRGPVGFGRGREVVYLDVHEKYHGPHGLVAGTTGSGKSETLQTYILSLAVNYSPEDVSFFLIDYKGGGMADLFRGLPHLTGQISNLSENQVRRAMVSVKSENRRRQRVFQKNGVNNISAYTRLYKAGETKEPVPHLFLIVDEFAELKKEEPDFLKELISVAQVGRSLGVHLILSTQKPSGTVDENIRSNCRFRLCLRVQDRQDSLDMLQRPDAAYLTRPGRCCLQVGNNEMFEQFQSGYSGASLKEAARKKERKKRVC
ncbi:MAG: FHA domain-containing protein [Blautia sp.]|nr:FHA domain-containing protein [Blautia sp.]